MSNSYKKTPIIKDGGNSKKEQKRIASHKVRAILKEGNEIPSGNAYKKHYNTYNITDCVCRWTKEDATKQYENNCVNKKRYPTLKSWLNYWRKCVRSK